VASTIRANITLSPLTIAEWQATHLEDASLAEVRTFAMRYDSSLYSVTETFEKLLRELDTLLKVYAQQIELGANISTRLSSVVLQ
jgi:hypothetical protein